MRGEAPLFLLPKNRGQEVWAGHNLLVRKWSTFLLLLLIAGAAGTAYWLSGEEDPPPWKHAYRESVIVEPSGQEARIRALLQFQGQGGTSSLARSLSRGAALEITGTFQGNSSDLLFRLRGGQGEAVWRQLRAGERSLLAVGGLPYRSGPRTFLDIDWPEALRPRRLLRVWPALEGAAPLSSGTEKQFYAYHIRTDQKQIVGSIPLLRALLPGNMEALIQRSSGAPGGIVFERTIRDRSISDLLGLGQPLDVQSLRVRMRYEVVSWRSPSEPRIPPPESLRPAGRAALEVALLPFFVGLQGGSPDS